jgi:tRNA 2-selenouridine synthase
MLQALRSSECIGLELPLAERIRLLRDDYRHFEASPQQLCGQLECLTALHGAANVARWKSLVLGGDWDSLVACLLEEHYDPVYRRSLRSNYRQAAGAVTLGIDSADTRAFEQAARRLVFAPQ